MESNLGRNSNVNFLVDCFGKLTLLSKDGTDFSKCVQVVKTITNQHNVSDVIAFIRNSPTKQNIELFNRVLKHCSVEWLVQRNSNKVAEARMDGRDDEDELLRDYEGLVKDLCDMVLNTLQIEQEGPLDENDFPKVAENSFCILNCLQELICSLEKSETNILPQLLKSRSYLMVEIIAVNADDQLVWTDLSSISAARHFQESLLQCSKATDSKNILTGSSHDNNNQKNSVLSNILNHIQNKLTKGTWKLNPGAVQIFSWCLFHIHHPKISDYLDQLLPPSLLLSDDYLHQNKLIGVRMLDHIIRNTSATELSWFGRSEVIYEALHRHLYTHEPDMIAVLHPCLLELISAINRSQLKTNDHSTWDKVDDVFNTFLFDMEMENKIVLRRAYSEQMENFIHALGLGVVRHFRRLLRVIYGYLEVYDGPEEQARLNVLQVVKAVITVGWPRIPNHAANIVKALLRLVCDISRDTSLTPSSVKQSIIDRAKECLVLLKQLCESQVVDILEAVREISDCSFVVREVLST